MVVRYRNLVQGSGRWATFAFRGDDIVISAPAMSQTHGRFIKTHTPLDGRPFDERVTYLCVGRDPRDVAVSSDHHRTNMDFEAVMARRAEAVGLDDLDELGAPPAGAATTDPVERFWLWAEDANEGEDRAGHTLAGILRHLQTFWDRRYQPNIALFHYSDLSADLPGQLRRLAGGLSIGVSEERIRELAAAATFERMKGRAEVLAPNSDQGLWRSTEDFFHRGSNGQWRELLDDAGLRRYWSRVRAIVPPDLARWAHNGWLGASPPS